MKLPDHVHHIRQLTDTAFRNRLGRMGVHSGQLSAIESIPSEYQEERRRIETIREVFIAETGTAAGAYEKLIEELTFTLFNRLAALKVMEAHTLHPEIVTRRETHGGRSFAHLAWLEQNPTARSAEAEGLLTFMEDQLSRLSGDIPLFSTRHPYHLLPTALELNSIMNAFNQVETDAQVETDIWKSDDVLGWLYESYNNEKKRIHKESKNKTEYDKVSIQSQVYTPRWVVKFLVDNSLGKLYLEMFPDSTIINKYKIIRYKELKNSSQDAKTPNSQPPIPNSQPPFPNPQFLIPNSQFLIPNSQFLIPNSKKLHEIRLIDPSTGSGNFLLYAFDLFYDLYLDQIENYGADYNEADIPKLIIENNLHGIDLDDRAVQLAQLGLYIKAKRKKRTVKIERFNIVSSDFFLPTYEEVKTLFENGQPLDPQLEKIVIDLWADLQQAHKFGSLIRLEEKFSLRLHGLVKDEGVTLFSAQNLLKYEEFRENFFTNLQKALTQNTARQGQTFLNTKTQDAITFLQLLTQKYDVAVANPPYTDSADFGTELKKFVEANYKQPYKFNTNLYAAFIKRCCEITTNDGYVGMIHPHTFMFIKTFEDVRKFFIKHTHIELMVDYGLDRVNLFGPGILLDATWYVLSKKTKDDPGVYFNITANQQEKAKQKSLEQAYDDAVAQRPNPRVYNLPQEKLKIIEGWPFIYWISDGFREKFRGGLLNDYVAVCSGLATCNNDMFLRYWWEVETDNKNHQSLGKKWFFYSKGGPFNKWFGNLWCTVNWEANGRDIHKYNNIPLDYNGAPVRNKRFYFQEGVTYSASGSKGATYRYLPPNCIFDVGGASIFFTKSYRNITYLLAFLNSNLSFYIVECLNPTVNTQVGDLRRLPFIEPKKLLEDNISSLAIASVAKKQMLNTFRIIEINFEQSPLMAFQGPALKDRILAYVNYENAQLTCVLINEAIINELIFKVYELSSADKDQVEAKMGKSIGQLGITNYELGNGRSIVDLFIEEADINNELVLEHLRSLPLIEFEPEKVREIKEGFSSLYQSNNDLEEFCIRHQVNPINVWYWFKEANILPPARAAEITLEFLADAIRTLLMDDEDGIIPLTGLPGEPRLSDRLEQHCLQQGFTSAQYMQLDSLLGRPINEYIEHHFFRNLSDHLNLFMYLPKTPFIWHLSSGPQQGLEVFIIIYKWNRDSLFKLKSQYISHRVQNLEYRQIQLQDVSTAQAQNEKEQIRLQLKEIENFTKKIDELIAEGYDPKLDDGVGKNIAPLQKKGVLRSEVLKKSQLEKYLEADW